MRSLALILLPTSRAGIKEVLAPLWEAPSVIHPYKHSIISRYLLLANRISPAPVSNRLSVKQV